MIHGLLRFPGEIARHEEALSRFQGGLMINLGPEDSGLLPTLKEAIQSHQGKQPVSRQSTMT